MKRKAGFYWVKNYDGKWFVSEYDESGEWIKPNGKYISDLDERQILNPNE